MKQSKNFNLKSDTNIYILQNYLSTFGIPNTIYKFFITYLQTHRYATFITLPIAKFASLSLKYFYTLIDITLGLNVVRSYVFEGSNKLVCKCLEPFYHVKTRS